MHSRNPQTCRETNLVNFIIFHYLLIFINICYNLFFIYIIYYYLLCVSHATHKNGEFSDFTIIYHLSLFLIINHYYFLLFIIIFIIYYYLLFTIIDHNRPQFIIIDHILP